MTDSSIGIQAVSPFSGTSQGRNEAFRDQNAQAALARQQQQQQDEPEQHAAAADSAHQVDVTV